ncbi:MAG: YbaN family protein [Mangrovicoccus sp.]
MRILWLSFGILTMGLGLLGAILPLLPTVPFFLLATFCFARSSPRLHEWLITHPTYGGHIRAWQSSGAIRPAAKRVATLSIGVAFLISVILGVGPKILVIQALVLGAVLVFLWTRPDQ